MKITYCHLLKLRMLMKRIVFLLMFAALPALAEDASGVWKVDGQVADNTIAATCTLKQTDNVISGDCKLDADHALPAKGEVKGNQVIWKFDVDHEGTVYTLTFTGTMDTAKSMKGSISVDPSDSEGDFTAKKE
jgi:hypothetical protein